MGDVQAIQSALTQYEKASRQKLMVLRLTFSLGNQSLKAPKLN